MADPFLSTEYEDVPPEKSELPSQEQMEAEDNGYKRKQKSAKNNKRKHADDSVTDSVSIPNLIVEENVSKPKANPPKKRKVVKF